MPTMNLKELIKRNRSYRRFDPEVTVERETLTELVDLARMSASAANRQPLKYILSHTSERNEKIYPTLSWAGYLEDWDGPAEEERPPAYIAVLGDKDISKKFFCDHGIAVQSILLGAVEKGLGGCILAAINREKLRKAFDIPSRYEILLVVALGKPAEEVVLEKVSEKGDIKYWRDGEGVHHVPKRDLDEVILK